MNKRIKTYEDLVEEQQRLVSLLKTQESFIKVDIAGVREGLQPFGRAMTVVNKMATRDNTAPVLNFGMEMGIDLLIRRVLLARAGWFTKIVVPFLIKNYSSHIIGVDKRMALIGKVKGFFKKIRPQAAPQAPVEHSGH
ncbi:MAG TPA: hypothetical protein VGB56_10550 [Flavisolibacter sp.]|jgi:hypothetical protein